MVLEHAVLNVRGGQEAEFEGAFATAKAIIAASPGFQSLRLGRCLEHEGRYVLLVEWRDLDAHVTGFRGSPRYEEWRRLLHHFYEPFPVVEHYEDVATIP
ncbi:MAG TPA: antibiotic biosynthesis monooxygenase [Acidimicrobiales bacterium]|nr:antibiotic biosynthesis monooxygenase [Acidimicrobiales bacterium]